MPFPEPFLTGRPFPVKSLSEIGVAQESILFGSGITHPSDIFSASRRRRNALTQAKSLARFLIAKQELLVKGIRGIGMEIVHFPIDKEGVFAVAALPESIAITHKNQGVAFVKNTVGAENLGGIFFVVICLKND